MTARASIPTSKKNASRSKPDEKKPSSSGISEYSREGFPLSLVFVPDTGITGTSKKTDPTSVLLIARNRRIGQDLTTTLQEIGCGVVLTSVEGALSRAFSFADVAVIDLAAIEPIYPVEFGVRIGAQLRKPVVYLVGDDDQRERVRELVGGAVAVTWPFSGPDLERALQSALEVDADRPPTDGRTLDEKATT